MNWLLAVVVATAVCALMARQYSHFASSGLIVSTRPSTGLVQKGSGNVSSPSRKKQKAVYICITGQLARLELKNKIQRLLVPLRLMGYTFHIGLALSYTRHDPHYTNKNNGDMMQLYTTLEDAIDELANVTGVEKVVPLHIDHSKILYINEKYRVQLSNNNTKYSRAKNHIRQYRTLASCDHGRHFIQAPDFVVRIREDVLIEKINISHILSNVQKGMIVTSECDKWRGMNDKVAILPASLAHDYFTLPSSNYDDFNETIEALNPETYYNYTYSSYGLPLGNVDSFSVTKAVTRRVPTNITHCYVGGNPHHPHASNSCSFTPLEEYAVECWK